MQPDEPAGVVPMTDRIISAAAQNDEEVFDRAVRPKRLADYVGQSSVKTQMEIFIEAARKRREALDHVLIFGPPGLGKTTLANIIANELQVNLKQTSGPVIERPGDLAALLTNLQPNDVLFVDEIHSLLQSGVHERGPFSDANEGIKAALGKNEIACIGCTTLAEYRRFIEPDRALVRRFSLVRLDPPSREATIGILRSRLERLRKHYAPLVIPESILPDVVDLTDEYAPALHQPDKSIQLIDAACAACSIEQPPAPAATTKKTPRPARPAEPPPEPKAPPPPPPEPAKPPPTPQKKNPLSIDLK